MKRSTRAVCALIVVVLTYFTLDRLTEEHRGPADDLRDVDEALCRVSMSGNRTVIITFLTEAWAREGGMMDLFLDSFHRGNGTQRLLQHLIFVAMDGASYVRCQQVHPHCYNLTTPGIDFSGGEKLYMSPDFLKMMLRRVQFLGEVLQLGYNFVLTDMDIVWLRDPIDKFWSSGADVDMSCDFSEERPNTGLLHVVSSRKTVALYDLWYRACLVLKRKNEQSAFKIMRRWSSFQRLGLTINYVSTELLGTFCRLPQDMERVMTMHANCCAGLERKLQDLRLVMEEWTRYSSMSPAQRLANPSDWRFPNACRRIR